jgi:multicomponent Na+:H+ antiporter subunit G
MSTLADIWTVIFLLIGGCFFFAGTVGLMRFPDVHSRLHALSKADNLGLGFIAIGLMAQAESVVAGLKILIVWLIALLASALTCYLVADWETDNERNSNNL